MKNIYLVLIICLVILNQTKANEQLRVVYYSTIEFVETPLSYIKGSVPLESAVALNRNHYAFSYDLKNRLISIAFNNGSNPKNPNHTANLFTLAHRMEFSYEDEAEKVRFFNTKGEPISVLGDCSQFVYKLNQLGFRESLHFLDKSGNRIENSWNVFEYKWEYLNDGAVIEDRFNKIGESVSIRPGFEFGRLKLYFNNAGHIALIQNIDQKGNLVENSSGASQDRITTNANGNFIQWEVLNNKHQLEKGNGPDVAVGVQKFDQFGYEAELEHRDESNKLIFSSYGICKSKTEYDKYGNISERTFYNEENNPSNHQNAGYHKFKMTWDKFGNNLELLTYFDINDKPTSHIVTGCHSVKYDYNSNKELIKISFFDVDGQLVNVKTNGVSYITFQYNNGERTSSRFDKEGKEL